MTPQSVEELLTDAIESIRRKAHACNRPELTRSARNEIRDLCDLTLAKVKRMKEPADVERDMSHG